MNKKTVSTIIISALFFPLFVGAQGSASNPNEPLRINAVLGTTTPEHIFTACTQIAIEKRDTAIAAAKNVYNVAMETALTARKEAEKSAVALTDATTKQAAMKAAVDAYRTAAKTAQDNLAKERKGIWAAFEVDGKSCRDAKQAALGKMVADKKADIGKKKEERKNAVEMKKASTTEMKLERKSERDERKASTTELRRENKELRASTTPEARVEIEKNRQEIKAIRAESKSRIESIRDRIRAFWSR